MNTTVPSSTTHADQAIDIDALRDALRGDLHTPEDPSWDEARLAWNLVADQRPELVVFAADAGDIETTVRAAAEAGLVVAPQGTGHSATAHDSLAGCVLLKTERMRGVEIDPVAKIARVEAGVVWAEVAAAAAEHGLAALQGSAHDVGVVGYTLGGGISFLARKHGLASQKLVAAEVVGADGVLRRVDADSDPELLWALRGGGGEFGVVASIEIELLEIASVYAGGMLFPQERASEVLQAWREWTAGGLPEEMMTVGRVLNFPPLPDLPGFLRGRKFAAVEVYWLGEPAEGERLIAPIRALGPEIDSVAEISTVDMLQVHMDPPGPVPGIGDHQLLGRLDAEAIDRLLTAVGPDSGAPLVGFQIRHLGGALARGGENAGALGAIDAAYATYGVGAIMAPEMVAPVREALAVARNALEPYEAKLAYGNFTDKPVDPASLFDAGSLGRLRRIKLERDPGGLFRGNHPVGS